MDVFSPSLPLFPAPAVVVGGFNGGGVFSYFLFSVLFNFCLAGWQWQWWCLWYGERERGRPEPCHPKPPVPRINPAATRYQSQLAIKRQTFLPKYF